MCSRNLYYTCFYRVSVLYDEIRNRHFFDVKRACETKSVFDKINVKEVMVIERKITFQKQTKQGKNARGNNSKKGRGNMKKRLISMLLSAALFVTSIPMPVSADNQVNEGNASTAVSSEGNQGETQENGIDYKMNGGAFTSGYEAPVSLN